MRILDYEIHEQNTIYKNDNNEFCSERYYQIEVTICKDENIIDKINEYAMKQNIWTDKRTYESFEYYDMGSKNYKFFELEMVDLSKEQVYDIESFIIAIVKERG